jgi:hypothetical protein
MGITVTIKTKGGKDPPEGTKVKVTLIEKPETFEVELLLPGQNEPRIFKPLFPKNGILELPINLVFLSHAKEDSKFVKEISDRLFQDGILTWFDEDYILPGDNWKQKIEQGIDISDYVIIFLSKNSIDKTGYVQKEFKIVLEKYELIPSGKRYIIPILLDDSTPPREFKDIQWLRVNNERWYENLIRAIS